ncbi:MAG: SDR family oxidoreductase [Geminicoccaceae bacterium]
MDLDLAGKSVLITGATGGIGQGLAEGFAAEGATVYLTGRKSEVLESVRGRLTGRFNVRVETMALDLAERGAARELADRFPDTDIVVNNAGAIPGGDLWSVDEDAWRRAFDLKVYGYIDLTRALYPRMKERGGGVVINDIGNAGERPDFDYICGTTGNAALMAFTRALGGRSIDDGIRVIGVNPGPVATDRIVKLLKTRARDWYGDESRWEELTQRYPLKRAATVQEVVDTMVFLASPRCTYMSGTIVTIDGGISSRSSIV